MFEKINYKLIISHSFAGFFLLWAFREFVYIYDSELLEIYDRWNFIDAWRLDNKAERLGKFLAIKITSSYIGIIAVLLISLIITIRKKLGAVNSVIVFFTTIILLKVDVLTNDYVESVVYFPGEIIYGFSVQSVTFNGIYLLTISFVIFFFSNRCLFRKNKDVEDNYEPEI